MRGLSIIMQLKVPFTMIVNSFVCDGTRQFVVQ